MLVKWNTTSSLCLVALPDCTQELTWDMCYLLLWWLVLVENWVFSQYSIFCKHVCLRYWATDRKLDLQSFLYFMSMRIYTCSTRPHYVMVLCSMAVFVTFRQHGPRLNLDADHIVFGGLHRGEQFEEELEQETLNISEAGGHFSPEKLVFTALCLLNV